MMREVLVDICDAEIQSDDPSCYTLADAIIEALPDMMPDLVWQRNGNHYAGGYGFVINKIGKRFALTVRNGHMQMFETLDEAKAAANAHHKAQVMAMLGLEKE